jgi:group I intron endonuclease
MIIYKAFCKKSGKSYVGKTTGSMRARINGHLCDSKLSRYGHIKFYRAIRKYGIDAFEWSILQICHTIEELNVAERQWIRVLDSKKQGYNSTDGGDGLWNPSLETRKKMSIAASRTRNFTGHHHSQASKDLIALAQIGKKLTKQHVANIRAKMDAVQSSAVYKQKMSTLMIARGTPYQKIPASEIAKVKQMYSSGLSQSKIAQQYNVSQVTIHNIIHEKMLYSKDIK